MPKKQVLRTTKLKSCISIAEQLANIAATTIPNKEQDAPLFNQDEITIIKDHIIYLIDLGMQLE
jgi:hypothetical protein